MATPVPMSIPPRMPDATSRISTKIPDGGIFGTLPTTERRAQKRTPVELAFLTEASVLSAVGAVVTTAIGRLNG